MHIPFTGHHKKGAIHYITVQWHEPRDRTDTTLYCGSGFHVHFIDVRSSQRHPWFSPNSEHMIGCEDCTDWSRQRRGGSNYKWGDLRAENVTVILLVLVKKGDCTSSQLNGIKMTP